MMKQMKTVVMSGLAALLLCMSAQVSADVTSIPFTLAAPINYVQGDPNSSIVPPQAVGRDFRTYTPTANETIHWKYTSTILEGNPVTAGYFVGQGTPTTLAENVDLLEGDLDLIAGLLYTFFINPFDDITCGNFQNGSCSGLNVNEDTGDQVPYPGLYAFFEVSAPTDGTVPEPDSLALLGLGLCALGALRKRKAR